jgi:DNA-binding MarR family transcriptional regulator
LPASRNSKKQASVDGVVENFSLINHPFYLFNQIFLARGREINQDLAAYDLDYQKWRVLVVLNEFPDCTMLSLAETAGVDRTTLTHTVRLMIEVGLVSKVERESDRRSVALSLTNKGRKALRAILPAMIAINERCFADFSKAEMNQFMGQLRRIFKNLTNGGLPPLIEGAAAPAAAPAKRNFSHASVTVNRRSSLRTQR